MFGKLLDSEVYFHNYLRYNRIEKEPRSHKFDSSYFAHQPNLAAFVKQKKSNY